MSKISIRSDGTSSGTKIMFNGEEIKCVKSFELSMNPNSFSIAKIEFYDVEFNLIGIDASGFESIIEKGRK
jgi:hypothetical protein